MREKYLLHSLLVLEVECGEVPVHSNVVRATTQGDVITLQQAPSAEPGGGGGGGGGGGVAQKVALSLQHFTLLLPCLKISLEPRPSSPRFYLAAHARPSSPRFYLAAVCCEIKSGRGRPGFEAI